MGKSREKGKKSTRTMLKPDILASEDRWLWQKDDIIKRGSESLSHPAIKEPRRK